jgi:3-hydroxyacyl-CoA dehydrogenase
MNFEIKKVAVIGSGVMGSAIAGHLANAGIPSYLLDIVPPKFTDDDKAAGLTESSPQFRNKFAMGALSNTLVNLKPAPLFDKKVLKLITLSWPKWHSSAPSECKPNSNHQSHYPGDFELLS